LLRYPGVKPYCCRFTTGRDRLLHSFCPGQI